MNRLNLRSSQEKRARVSFLKAQKVLLFKMQVSAGAQCDGGLEPPEAGLKMSPAILSRHSGSGSCPLIL